MKQKINKHPKYGDLPKKTRCNNGYNRSRITQHRLKCALQRNIIPGCKYSIIWFDEDKDRYILYGASINAKRYCKYLAKRMLRRTRFVGNYGGYRKIGCIWWRLN
jgi:hypothetical protein